MKVRIFFPIMLPVFFTLLCGCKKMEYSPNQVFSEKSESHLNAKNIEWLLSTKDKNDTLSIAFIGDTQRFYDECEMFVDAINKTEGIDLVVIAGDISQYGLEKEFEWITRIFNKLKVPYVAVIGNHDMVGNGTKIFEHTYGELDYTFVYDSVKFVCHNTNSREYAFNGKVPDISWLQQEMITGPEIRRILPISHVPPYNDDFDRKLESDYAQTLRSSKKVSLSLHGHAHYFQDSYPYEDGIRYLNGYAMDSRAYLRVNIAGLYSDILNLLLMKAPVGILIVCLCFFRVSAQKMKSLVPDYGKVQHAGSIGFVSAGLGYEFFKSRINTESMYGYVPVVYGGPLHIATFRLIILPVSFHITPSISVTPVNVSGFVTYHFGDQFYVVLPQEYYKGYYKWSSAIRYHVGLGSMIAYKSKRNGHGFALFYEFNTNDLYFKSLTTNSSLNLEDILALGIGVKIY